MKNQSMKIQMAEGLYLDLRYALSKQYNFFGNKGSGKTYAAGKMIEQMLYAGGQVVIIDPVGIWYGLRILQDGKTPSGLNIPVFGGLYSDLPLNSNSGKLIADIISERQISAVLDVSQMEDDELNTFASDFGQRLFMNMKKNPSPIHLVLEECQEIIPEILSTKGDNKKIKIYKRISKLGRNYGIGMSLISQRPQEVSKPVVNLSEVMFAFRMNGIHEREVIEKWIKEKGCLLYTSPSPRD